MNTYERNTHYDIESLIRNKHKKEKKQYPDAYGSNSTKFAANDSDQAFLLTAPVLQQNTPSYTGQSGEAFSQLKRTDLFCRSGSVSKLKGGLLTGRNAKSEVNDVGQKTPSNLLRQEPDDKQNRVNCSAEGQVGSATDSDKRKSTAGQNHLKSIEDKQQLQSVEAAPVLEQQFSAQKAKASEAEHPTGQTATYIADALQVKDTDRFDIEYRFSRWQGDHSVTLSTTAGTVQSDELLMYPSSQRVMETLNAHANDWNGNKPLIVHDSYEEASQNQSGRQQHKDEDDE